MGLGSIVGGLINMGRGQPSVDLSALFDTISKAGTRQREMINALPESLKPLYEQYKASLGTAGEKLQATSDTIGKKLLEDTKALYGPDNEAVKATLAALKTEDYSTLPGTLTNLKAQLAATGGLARGGAGRAITEAVLAPAQQYGQQAMNVQAQQLQLRQQNVQQALNVVASLDESTMQQLFGMSTTEAANILTYGRDDLKDQLSQLITQSVNETNQVLGVQGLQAQDKFQRDVAESNARNALTNDITGTVAQPFDAAWQGMSNDLSQGASGWLSSFMGGGGGPGYSPQQGNIDVTSDAFTRNQAANRPRTGGGGGGSAVLKGLTMFA